MRINIDAIVIHALVGLLLIGLTWLAHGNALDGYWRFDDGWILDFATRFTPSEYFFDPMITRAFSPSNITPWNPFVFDLNLFAFGLDVEKYYIQHLLAVTLAAATIFLLLNYSVTMGYALFGAGLFIVGAPVFHVSQELMVGHYVYGLIFANLSVYAFFRARSNVRGFWLPTSTLLYVLATTCKEVFVPLPLVLLFVSFGSWRSRVVGIMPFAAWGIFYMAWRFTVLGTAVGGYRRGVFDWAVAARQLLEIPGWLLGNDVVGLAAAGLLAAFFFVAMLRRIVDWRLSIVVILVLVVPLLALVAYPGLRGPNRYLLLPWAVICVAAAYMLGAGGRGFVVLRVVLGSVLFWVVLGHGLDESAARTPDLARFDAIYKEAIEAAPDTLMVVRGGTPRYWDVVLNGARRAHAVLDNVPFKRVSILTDPKQLDKVDFHARRVREYSKSCDCFVGVAPPGEALAGQAEPLRSFEHLPFGPPYPALFDRMGGAVETTRVSGTSVSVTGWVDLLDADPDQVIILLSPGLLVSQKLNTQVRADLAERLGNDEKRFVGFRLDLDYSDNREAISASKTLCVLSLSSYTGMQVLDGPVGGRCDALLNKEGTR
ncbi:MAG: hypothetical protein H6953_08300 [Chromatiaceae bacterium]|nr:hypothetical protein [Chromatiaceae bacterium]MCP5315393.1 hypothetical protein [Chromatiaceae bacterium]